MNKRNKKRLARLRAYRARTVVHVIERAGRQWRSTKLNDGAHVDRSPEYPYKLAMAMLMHKNRHPNERVHVNYPGFCHVTTPEVANVASS